LTLDEFFLGHERSRPLFDVTLEAINSLGPASLRVTKSQIAFRRRKAFAWAWIPEKYMRGKTSPCAQFASARDPRRGGKNCRALSRAFYAPS
jgi:hypothetical protein